MDSDRHVMGCHFIQERRFDVRLMTWRASSISPYRLDARGDHGDQVLLRGHRLQRVDGRGLGTHGYCSPRHWMPFKFRIEGCHCV
jgi:hypothetical protein